MFLAARFLWSPIGGVVRGFEIGELGDQSVAHRLRLVRGQHNPRRPNHLALPTGARRGERRLIGHRLRRRLNIQTGSRVPRPGAAKLPCRTRHRADKDGRFIACRSRDGGSPRGLRLSKAAGVRRFNSTPKDRRQICRALPGRGCGRLARCPLRPLSGRAKRGRPSERIEAFRSSRNAPKQRREIEMKLKETRRRRRLRAALPSLCRRRLPARSGLSRTISGDDNGVPTLDVIEKVGKVSLSLRGLNFAHGGRRRKKVKGAGFQDVQPSRSGPWRHRPKARARPSPLEAG